MYFFIWDISRVLFLQAKVRLDHVHPLSTLASPLTLPVLISVVPCGTLKALSLLVSLRTLTEWL